MKTNRDGKKINNLVAKHCWKFNVPKVYKDKTKYIRKQKHTHKEEIK